MRSSKLFKKRLESFYSTWNRRKENQWSNSHCLVLCTPPEDSPQDRIHPISSSFLIWLIGDNFPDTIVVFAQDEIFFICTKKSFPKLKTLADPAMESVGAKVLIHKMSKKEESGVVVDHVLKMIKSKYRGEEVLRIGCVWGETPESRIVYSCENNLKLIQYQIAFVNDGFTRLCVKNHENSSSNSDCHDFDIQMESLPDKVVQMLSLSPKAPKAEEQKQLELEFVEKQLKQTPLDSERDNGFDFEEESSCGNVDEEEDEWILVDCDEEEDRFENGRYDYIWRKLPLS